LKRAIHHRQRDGKNIGNRELPITAAISPKLALLQPASRLRAQRRLGPGSGTKLVTKATVQTGQLLMDGSDINDARANIPGQRGRFQIRG